MDQDLWTAVDAYLTEHLIPSDPILEATLRANRAAELPAIDVTPSHGKLLHLLARIHGAKRILEIGTLGGYSTIWLARALPSDGQLVTLEAEAKHAEIASANFRRAGVAAVIDLRLGPALASLDRLREEGAPPFDLIFIDADKQNNAAYLDWSVRLSRPGTVIVVDNVIREGAILKPEDADPRVQGTRRFFDVLAVDTRLDATAIQTVGSKGYDGLVLAVVRG